MMKAVEPTASGVPDTLDLPGQAGAPTTPPLTRAAGRMAACDAADHVVVDRSQPRLWGLTIAQLHDRFWRSRGVQVVRRLPNSAVDVAADLYLLAERDALVIFNPVQLADRMYWSGASLLRLRLHDRRRRAYDERIELDAAGRFVEIRRIYDRLESRLVRFGVTADAKVAQAWIECSDVRHPWREMIATIPRRLRAAASLPGRCYFDDDAADRAEFVRHLTQVWPSPDVTIDSLCALGPNVWARSDCATPSATRFVGPVWLGKRDMGELPPLLVGPGVIWDAPGEGVNDAEGVNEVDWSSIRPSVLASRVAVRPPGRGSSAAKRAIDVAFAIVALLLTLPAYPIVILAIWLEDGRPIFFGHRREKLGGAEFRCWKFRSMYRDAEKRRAELMARNRADGPQFYIPDDPRVTRVGRVLRRFNIDELPQFWNVLLGDMSVVGPRPSPRAENQFCPPWRDARLSVRPGVTGLWQVCRSRQGGNDFQEWIKYDLEYVKRRSLLLDLAIIWRSVHICVRGERRLP